VGSGLDFDSSLIISERSFWFSCPFPTRKPCCDLNAIVYHKVVYPSDAKVADAADLRRLG